MLVRRGLAAEAAHQLACLPTRDELAGVGVGQRRDTELGLSDQLREDAPRPEGDERAEDRILDDPREELGAALEHQLDDDRQADATGRLTNVVFAAEAER